MTGMVTTRKSRTSRLALLALLAAVGLSAAVTPMAASAAPATQSGAASEWPAAGDSPSSANAASLTGDALAPEGDTGSQRWLGFALLGLSVLGLTAALALYITSRPHARKRRGSRTSFRVRQEPPQPAASPSE